MERINKQDECCPCFPDSTATLSVPLSMPSMLPKYVKSERHGHRKVNKIVEDFF